MSNEEILQGNVKIAEFMGGKFLSVEDVDCIDFTEVNGDHKARTPVSKLNYHGNWNLLMPVWKKFGDLLYKNAPRNNQELYLQAHNITSQIVDGLREADIEKCFTWIIRGIDWYTLNVTPS